MGTGWKCPVWIRRQYGSRYASLGGRAAYIGKVRDDQLGRCFAMTEGVGVHFATPAGTTAGPSTASLFNFVTPTPSAP